MVADQISKTVYGIIVTPEAVAQGLLVPHYIEYHENGSIAFECFWKEVAPRTYIRVRYMAKYYDNGVCEWRLHYNDDTGQCVASDPQRRRDGHFK